MKYDLEERTKNFAISVRRFCRTSKKYSHTLPDIKQLVRSSGSIGANYLEANESLSKRDFKYRIKIAKKEAKETSYWLSILSDTYSGLDKLAQECTEISKILGAIYEKSK